MKTETKKVQLQHTAFLDNTKRNAQADFLLSMLKERLEGAERWGTRQGGMITLSFFENCRERGYTIYRSVSGIGGKQLYVNFAENRNSDDIVVYPFNWDHEDEKEVNYRTKSKYFGALQFQEAADFILKHLELTNEEADGRSVVYDN